MKITHLFKIASEMLLDLIYPKRCAVCQKMIGGYTDTALCPSCREEHFSTKVVRDDKFYFDEAIGILKYEGEVKSAMIKYKFKSAKYYAKAYAHVMNRAGYEREYLKDAVMCCVPLSRARDREYNQTCLIAKELSAMWGSEFISDLVVRSKAVGQISKMNLQDRQFFVTNSFDINSRYDIYGKDILLIDDILTSGTTANECAKMLKINGAENVYVLCACYD